MPYDRLLAVRNGSPIENATGWTDSERFHRLMTTERLASIDLRLTSGTLDLRLGEDRVALDLEGDLPVQAHGAAIRAWLGVSDRAVEFVARGAHLWDHRDAPISIINLDTVDALSKVIGRPVDFRRFRANIYLRGLEAWTEWSLVGTTLRIGEASLRIMRPTERCRATTVNPDIAQRDLNIPAALASRLGHLYFGLYAEVESGGTVRLGDPVHFDPPSPDGVSLATPDVDEVSFNTPGADGSVPSISWPRPVRIVKRCAEDERVTSFWLEGSLPRPLPGQHVRVHLEDESVTTWRCYTISDVERDRWRISVKREKSGLVSRYLHDHVQVGDTLTVTGPFGEATVDGDTPITLITAGIGITPAAAIVAAMARSVARPRIQILHTATDSTALGLWAEVRDGVRSLGGRSTLYLTRADAEECATVGAEHGRPSADDFAEAAAAGGVTYICGPNSFMRTVRDVLVAAGIPANRIVTETFYSPANVDLDPRTPTSTGPFTVLVKGRSLTWTPADGTLLDLVEGAGIATPSGCRAAACGTCLQPITGTIEYLLDPVEEPPPGSALLCCTVPTSNLIVGT
ncbi:MOSC domain-containing protein [Acrocarpospora macrocephala]|nr:MOSC domain-containing protein [Acrocarpospora macrocephala]